VNIDSYTMNGEDGLRAHRLTIDQWFTKYPNSDVAVILSAHSTHHGEIVHQFAKSNLRYAKSPLEVSALHNNHIPISLTYTQVVKSVLGTTAYGSLIGTKGTKFLLALTCGQAFSQSNAFDQWKAIATAG